jgi:hypothetical protein
MLSNSNTEPGKHMVSQGRMYYHVNTVEVFYWVSQQAQQAAPGSLVDGGANGGFSGSDVRVVEYTDRYADIMGIDNHVVNNVPIATVAGKIMTIQGPIIGIFHQYAYHGKGHTILSPHQMAHFGLDVDDKSVRLGHKQRITTPDGYVILLKISGGLPYMEMSQPSEDEMDKYPSVFFTSDEPWDPSVLDHTFDLETPDEFFDALEMDLDVYEHYDKCVTPTGEIIHPHEDDDLYGDHYDNLGDHTVSALACNHKVKVRTRDYEALRPNFAWAPIEVIKRTLDATTQMFCNMYRMPLRKHFKSCFPAANVPCRNEAVATDTIYLDTPAHQSCVKMAQIFVGRRTTVGDVYPLRKQAFQYPSFPRRKHL